MDIDLYQNDADTINFLLQETVGNTLRGANLTGSTVTCIMKHKTGTPRHSITCMDGATIEGVAKLFSQGGVHVDFTTTHTATAGEYSLTFIATKDGKPATFPSGRDKISVWIHPAL